MPNFEVFIPANQANERSVTLSVEADNWMAALKAGLRRLGQGGAQVANIMVDVMEDNSIHVTEPASGRVFRIKEQEVEAYSGNEAPTPRDLPAMDFAAVPKSETSRAAAKPEPVAPPRQASRATPAQVVKTEVSAPAAKTGGPKPQRVAPGPSHEVASTKVRPAAQSAEVSDVREIHQLEKPSQPVQGPIGRTRSSAALEDVFSDLFERTHDIAGLDRAQALAFLLDLALEKIPADAGSVFVSDLATADLELLEARGPRTAELKRMSLRVPVGLGIVGFCAKEAVSLAISDTERDDRFYSEVSRKIGYLSRSILCAPMVSGGRTFGCIEIINKKGSSHFSDAELAILAYLAHEGAKFLESA